MNWMRAGLCWAAFFFVLTGLRADPPVAKTEKSSPPSIRLSDSKGPPVVEVTGLSESTLSALARLAPGAEKWSEVLAVSVARDGGESLPLMLGTYRVEKSVLRFEPRFPLVQGVRYRAIFRPAALGSREKLIEKILYLPKRSGEPKTVVAAVYPSAERVPENLLKFYLHFSAPMSQGNSYRRIHLLDSKGKAIDLPFLELDEELWDPSGMRFTLFFDPGRIKRGLKPREEVGPALEEGKRYTLVIDQGWTDAEGNSLKEPFRKSFTVGAPDDVTPNPKTWKLAPPTAGTQLPLRLTFPESMDHALLHRLVWVIDSTGEKVEGKVAVAEKETVWLFTPVGPWRAGAYQLVADTRLEDLGGNSIGRPFEVDILRPVEREVKKETVKLAFLVKNEK